MSHSYKTLYNFPNERMRRFYTWCYWDDAFNTEELDKIEEMLDKEELERLVEFLKMKHSVRKRSLVMEDREEGGYLFFLYQPCDPRWVLDFMNG